jgi:diguanylate cyclase (GGDEF)-like protein
MLQSADVLTVQSSFKGAPSGCCRGTASYFGVKLWATFLVLLLNVYLIAAGAAQSQPAKAMPEQLRTITTAHEAHSLTSKDAQRHYPVHLRGVVTYHELNIHKNHPSFMLHDSTGSIFVVLPPPVDIIPLPPGTLIDLHGVTNAGEFAPLVDHVQVKILGTVPLPATSEMPSFAQISSGTEDSAWVAVEGVVHSVSLDENYAYLQLMMSDGLMPIRIRREPGANYSSLEDERVRIRGNVGPLFDVSRTKMIGARIRCPNLSVVQVLEAAPRDPFTRPVVAINRLLQWDVASTRLHRMHVRGRVTLLWPGMSVCLRDDTHGICAMTAQNTPLRIGELIDVAGFTHVEGSAPTLSDAIFRSVSDAPDAPVVPLPVTAEQALLEGHEFQLVQIDGQLISRDLTSTDTTLLIRSGKSVFAAILPRGLSNTVSDSWENGSILRITGVCSVQIDPDKTAFGYGTVVPKSFRILLRSPQDVIYLKSPSWWTPFHAIALLTLALALTLSILGWVMVLRKRLNQKTAILREQTELLRESEERFRHMALHDALTGLATRLLLQDRLDVAIESAKRHETGLAVFMIDLDKFKLVNDLHGHPAGDEVLRVSAERILGAVRPCDTVARLGGDEFIALLPDLNTPSDAELIAARIIAAIGLPIAFGEEQLTITASIGICTTLSGTLDADTLFMNADVALYRAKDCGRGRFETYCPEMATLPSNNY